MELRTITLCDTSFGLTRLLRKWQKVVPGAEA